MEDLPAGDFVTVVPIRTGVDQATVEKQLTIAPHYGEVGATAHRVGDLLVVARRELANVKKLSPAAPSWPPPWRPSKGAPRRSC